MADAPTKELNRVDWLTIIIIVLLCEGSQIHRRLRRDYENRRFGRTGWMVSEIGYGMWGMGEWSGSDDGQSLASLQLSVDLGCNFFDTAWASILLGQILSPGAQLASQLNAPGGALVSQLDKLSEGAEENAAGDAGSGGDVPAATGELPAGEESAPAAATEEPPAGEGAAN